MALCCLLRIVLFLHTTNVAKVISLFLLMSKKEIVPQVISSGHQDCSHIGL